MKLDKIGRQYEDDIGKALELGLVDERTAGRLARTFRQRIGRRMLRQRVEIAALRLRRLFSRGPG